jgi:hypothetical protein
MANDGINFFLSVINRFSVVKAATNAPRICKLCKNCLAIIDQCAMVLKNASIYSFFNQYIPSEQQMFTAPI